MILDLSDPESLYARVASHDAIRVIFAFSAACDLILEGGDVGNAYIYGDIDFEVIQEQPTNSNGKEAMPKHLCFLQNPCTASSMPVASEVNGGQNVS